MFVLCLAVGVVATAEDLWRRRVSNVVTAGAFVAGLAARSWLFGLDGTWSALLGGVYGFIVFLIFFLLGGMGGGDIKLMAGLGTIVGDEKIWLAAILTGMLGAMMALAYLGVRTVRKWFKRLPPGDMKTPARKSYIPYAPAISLGMLLTFFTEDVLWTNV